MNTDIASLVLNWITTYGAPMVAVLLLLGELGLPLPGTLLVIACGALIRQDMLDQYSTPFLGYAGAIVGDILLYGIGYFMSTAIERRFGETSAWKNARNLFIKRGGIVIYLSRWLLTTIAFPITLLAGSSRYSFRKFLLFVVLGEFTWIALYGGLGYAFGSQWELISDFISNFSGFILGGVILGLGVFLILKTRKRPVIQGIPVPENASQSEI